MAATDIVFPGFYYAIGYTLTVTIAGLDCGDYVVDQYGQVTVPINSDPNQLCNGAYLANFDVGPYDRTTYGDATTQLTISDGVGGIQTIYVPVVIGFLYPKYGQLVRPDVETDAKTPQGPAMGKTRRAHWVSANLVNTQGIAFGMSKSPFMDTVALKDNGGNVLNMNTLYSGVISLPIDDNPSFDGMIAWQIARPYPATVSSVSGFIETQER